MDQSPMTEIASAGEPTTIEGSVLSRETGPAEGNGGAVTIFSFGEPEGVMDRREILDFAEVYNNGRWYEPPVSMDGLTRAFDISPHHSSAILLKKNMLLKYFEPTRFLSSAEFGKWALDFLGLGNGYLERRDNMAGRPLRLVHSLGRYTKRGVEEGRYFFVPGYKQEHEFVPGSVFHLIEPDMRQEIYGKPQYMSALQSGFLNEAATLFRRRYYANGSHAGFLFYLNDPNTSSEDVDAIRASLKEAKGVGNFKNMFLHSPGGKEKGVQIIPIAEVAAKDEFLGIKNTTRDDMLAAHRVPPQLLGVVPQNSGGFGDVAKARDVFFENEIEPLQARFLEVNDWLGVEAVRFRPFVPAAAAA